MVPRRRARPRSATIATWLPTPPGKHGQCCASVGGDNGVSIIFNKRHLPCFTLWKNRQAVADGYVTGLEPGINFPNQRSFEERQGRVAVLAPGESRRFQVTIEAHPDAASVAAAQWAVAAIQAGATPEVCPKPDPHWSA